MRYASWVLAFFAAFSFSQSGEFVSFFGGTPQDPFVSHAQARVLIFVRTDCPITNRYAPELQRLYGEYRSKPVGFWLVYPDRTEMSSRIHQQLQEFALPGIPLLDPHHQLVHRARVTVAPEAAVFDANGVLRYHGRIDNRWVDVGRSRPVATVHDLEDAIAATLARKPVVQPVTRAIGCSLQDVE